MSRKSSNLDSTGSSPEWFSHVLLTRFNVRVDQSSPRPTDKWLADRLQLFETYTVRSLASQTIDRFEWLVFFDADTPDFARVSVDSLMARYANVFRPVYLSSQFSSKSIRPHLPVQADQTHLVTTRVDNDDAVSIDFMEQIQRHAHVRDLEFVNLIDGAQMSTGGVYRRPYTSNPFISLVERWSTEPVTVFVGGHDELSTYGPVRNVRTGHPMWLQVVHGQNLANEIVGVRTRADILVDWFEVPMDTLPRSGGWAFRWSQASSVCKVLMRLVTRFGRIRELYRAARVRRT